MGLGSKFSYGLASMFNKKSDTTLIHIARVVSIGDTHDANTIKAKISGIDDGKTNDDLPLAFPLIPKHLNVMPKVGESVLILKSTLDNVEENRLWVGPIISQPQKLDMDPHFFSSTSTKDGGFAPPEQAPSRVPEARGVYPDKEYISIQGRKNNDIIFKDNELLIRNGKHTPDNNLNFNKDTISYIKIKNNTSIGESRITKPTIDLANSLGVDTDEKGGITTIVSDKINLITHNGNRRFNITNQDDLISDGEMKRILENASPLVYGDKLNELLELMKEYVNNHTHPYHNLPCTKTKLEQDILNFNLNDLISKNIKIS